MSDHTDSLVEAEQVAAFQADGAVCLPGLFADWVDVLVAGVDRNMANPSEFLNHYGTAAEGRVAAGQQGLFFDDYCNWQRVIEFEQFVTESVAARAAAELMQSTTAQFFHDHVLVKEATAAMATPWHSDSPYYFVDGTQTVSFWVPLDPVDDATLRLIRGSHLWDAQTAPVSWVDGSSFYDEPGERFRGPIDPDTDPQLDVLEWAMEPGDAVAFDFRTTHGARANDGERRRRAFSTRWVGDDARYVARSGPTSPPFTGHDMGPGDRLRTDWFPILHP